MEYDFEEEKIIEKITSMNAKHLLIQLPEGLKKDSFKIADFIQDKSDVRVTISGSGSWGGCDLAIDEAKKIGADLLIHFGHAPFVKTDFPVVYVELKSKLNMVAIVEKCVDDIKIDNLGLISSVQHVHQINKIKEFLESKGKTVMIPEKKGFANYDGHVVGCEYNGLKDINNDVEGFLVIGNKFHSLGAALMIVDKPVYLLDEHTESLMLMDGERDKIIRQRAQSIQKIKDGRKIGILVDMKPGQVNFGIAKLLKEELEKLEKDVIVICITEVTPLGLLGFYDVDGFVNTACPRIGIDDYSKYEKPIINSREANVVIGKKNWNDLLEEGLVGFF